MAKLILSGSKAKYALKRGVDILAKTVGVTLGPKGHPVGLTKRWARTAVFDDGVVISREFDLANPFEDLGVQLVKEAAAKTNDACGDGTTTATVLARAIINEGLKNIMAGTEAISLKRGIEKATAAILAELEKASKPVKSHQQMVQVATIAAKDREIGNLVADVLEKVGEDGVVTIEESKGVRLEVEHVKGVQFDRGYISPYFITDQARQEAVIEEPYILITDGKIDSSDELFPALEKIIGITENLVIFAEDVEGNALATLVVNKLHGNLKVLAVQGPSLGGRQKERLEDIAIVTGSRLFSWETGSKLESVTEEDLGRAHKVVSNKGRTTILGGRGDAEAIENRIRQIKAQIQVAQTDVYRRHLRERQAALAGGIAIIRVGAATETEMKVRKNRIEDALAATKAALAEGILPGGGVGLLNALTALDKLKLDGDEATGVRTIKKALEEPIRWIASNAGKNSSVIVDLVKNSPRGQGYNAETDQFGDMVEMGVIDPTMVVRSALQNAVSIAKMILITESAVVNAPEEGPLGEKLDLSAKYD